MPKHRRHRAGRPRRATAKRRATTIAGRRPETDLGSPELLYRKARAANGTAAPVEITDVAGILLAHELITREELATLRQLAFWLHLFARAYGLKLGSVAGVWNALLAGGGDMGQTPTGTDDRRSGGDAALFRLIELRQHFARLHQLERLALVMRIAADEAHPESAADLAELRAGLAIIADMQRGRGRALAAE